MHECSRIAHLSERSGLRRDCTRVIKPGLTTPLITPDCTQPAPRESAALNCCLPSPRPAGPLGFTHASCQPAGLIGCLRCASPPQPHTRDHCLPLSSSACVCPSPLSGSPSHFSTQHASGGRKEARWAVGAAGARMVVLAASIVSKTGKRTSRLAGLRRLGLRRHVCAHTGADAVCRALSACVQRWCHASTWR